MISKIVEYNDTEDECQMVWDRLTEICEDIFKKMDKVVKWGFFGTWNGPQFGGSFITTPEVLRGHICQDFTRPMSFELSYTDEEIEVEPTQRYYGSTALKIPANSLILKQWHHDGCNVYYLRGYVSGDNPKTAETKDIEMEE